MDDPRRRGKRHRVEALTCDLGEVINLSTCGARVATTGKPPLRVGQVARIRLLIPEGSIVLEARVVWLRRKGLRRFQIGLDFVGLKPGVAAALDRLARFGFLGFGGRAASSTEHAGPGRPATRPSVRASIDLPDYYGTLGLPSQATAKQVRDAFRSLARRHHPDVSDDPDSGARFMQIHEAYEVLRDHARRRSYDERRAG